VSKTPANPVDSATSAVALSAQNPCAKKTNCASSELQEQKLDEKSLSILIGFFRLLDKWDREINNDAKIM